jgi:hypothetical protein
MALRLNVGNLNNVSDAFPVIPEGVYEVQVMEIASGTSQKQKPMLTLKHSVVNNAEYMGHPLWDRISLTEAALWKLKQFCEAAQLGWDDEGVDVEPAIGRVILVKVAQEMYDPGNGKVPRLSNKIDEYMKRD